MKASNDLIRLVEDFDTYRKTRRSKRDPIPKELWQRAVDQARLVPPSRVAISLGITPRALIDRLKNQPNKLASNKIRVAAVKMPIAAAYSSVPTLELIHPNGLRLSIKDFDREIMASVMAEFMRGESL